MEATNAGTVASGIGSERPSPCPSWCVADHDNDDIIRTHHSATIRLSPTGADFGRWIATEALTNDSDLWRLGEVVFLNANSMGLSRGTWPHLFLTPENAKAIAGIVDVLAAATPRQHRDLADGIRDCAALISGEDESGGPA